MGRPEIVCANKAVDKLYTVWRKFAKIAVNYYEKLMKGYPKHLRKVI